jgi:hypothetical protein
MERVVGKAPVIGIVIGNGCLGLMALSVTPSSNTATVEPELSDQSPVTIISCQWYALEHWQIHKLIIFNPTLLETLINTFSTTYAAPRARAIVALQGEGLYENVLVDKPTVSPAPEGYAWSTYSIDEQHWYVAALPYAVRAQYHLLSLRLKVPIISITTVTAAYCAMIARDKRPLVEKLYTSLQALQQAIASRYALVDPDPGCKAASLTHEHGFAHGLYLMAQQ